MKEIKIELFLKANPHIIEGINSTLLISEINKIRFEDSISAYEDYKCDTHSFIVTNINYRYVAETQIMRVVEIMFASLITAAYLERLEGSASNEGDILIQERRPLQITEYSISWRGKITRIPVGIELVEVKK